MLTVLAVRNAKAAAKPYKLADAGGLYLWISPKGSKFWRLDYRFNDKRKTLSLGAFPSMQLAEAREMRDRAKLDLRGKRDPSEIRVVAKAAAVEQNITTFRDVALRWYETRRPGWTEAYAARIWSRVEADINSVVGHMPIDAVQPEQLLEALRQIERRGAIESAHRVKQYVDGIFRYAKAARLVGANPALDLADALSAPPPPKHRIALKARDLPDFLRALEEYEGDERTRLAIRLTLLTFVRTNEARFAQWDEFEDLDGKAPLWRIPAHRMKMRTEHLIPLAPQAVAVIGALRFTAQKSPFVFAAPTASGVMSENTMIYALYRMGYHSRATVHGFRGTASTILNEKGFNRDWIERQLAHVERDGVRAAYNSAEWLPQRREMMVWWADYLGACVKR